MKEGKGGRGRGRGRGEKNTLSFLFSLPAPLPSSFWLAPFSPLFSSFKMVLSQAKHLPTWRKRLHCRLNRNQSESITRIDNFLTFLKPWFSSASPFGPFYRPKWQISLHFYTLHLVKSLPFLIPEAWKRYPFPAQPPHIGHDREYPPPPQAQTRRVTHFTVTELQLQSYGWKRGWSWPCFDTTLLALLCTSCCCLCQLIIFKQNFH